MHINRIISRNIKIIYINSYTFDVFGVGKKIIEKYYGFNGFFFTSNIIIL